MTQDEPERRWVYPFTPDVSNLSLDLPLWLSPVVTACIPKEIESNHKEEEVREFHFIREGQPGSELFTFVVPAQTLMELAQIDRFGDSREGVQRRLHFPHVEKLVRYMREPYATFAEPILGNLEGDWEVNRKTSVLTCKNGGYLSVDDGQQRIAALHLLSPEQRKKWEFKVTATLGIPPEQRARRFLQQLQRLKIDTHLVLQLQDRSSLFPDAISSKAYMIAKNLATNPESPLCGLIRLEERPVRRQPIGEDAKRLAPLMEKPPAVALREQTVGVINVGNIFRELRRAISSSRSIILHHEPDAQYKVIARLFTSAREIWPQAWEDPKHYFLRRAQGINALLQLLVVGQYFKAALTTHVKATKSRPVAVKIRDLKEEEIKKVLLVARHYDWSYQRFRIPNVKFPSSAEIALQLDSLIFQGGMPRRRVRNG